MLAIILMDLVLVLCRLRGGRSTGKCVPVDGLVTRLTPRGTRGSVTHLPSTKRGGTTGKEARHAAGPARGARRARLVPGPGDTHGRSSRDNQARVAGTLGPGREDGENPSRPRHCMRGRRPPERHGEEHASPEGRRAEDESRARRPTPANVRAPPATGRERRFPQTSVPPAGVVVFSGDGPPRLPFHPCRDVPAPAATAAHG